jgi:orotate phosphoribosyltransferase
MVAIFSYGFDIAAKNFDNAGVRLICLSHYEAMLTRAVHGKYIQDDTLQSLAAWRSDPANWTP